MQSPSALTKVLKYGIIAIAMIPAISIAQTWPERPITLVVPFPPGGSTDVSARILAHGLTEKLGQSVVVENRAGASGNIGSAYVARAKPDGYTLVMSGVGTHAANASLYSNLPYDPLKDFTHILSVASSPNAVVVNADFPARTFKDLIKDIQENPDKYNYASPGTGSSGHLAFELLKTQADLKIQHVPYKGASQALTDVIGGQVPILIMVADTLKPQVESGKIRVLAVTGKSRSPLFPDVPTVAESGFPGFVAESWTGLSAPAGLSDNIRDLLFKASRDVLDSSDVKAQYARAGNTVEVRNPDEFTSFVRDEIEKWKSVAKKANITQ